MRRKKKKPEQAIYARRSGAPVLSEETLRRLTELQARPGVHQVGIFHEQFCANALRKGAKKCVCTPDIRFIEGVEDGKAVEWKDQN